jgi:pyruvate-ferredoxin/flavodoxin oxidoreductase
MSSSRPGNRDLLAAVALAEGAVADRVLLGAEVGLELPSTNVFRSPIAVERLGDGAGLARRLAEARARGERVAIVAHAKDLASMRSELARVADGRVCVVVHAIADGEEATPFDMGLGPAFALADLPWGMLLGAGIADAVDLTLLARRASEDSAFPFLVVHPSWRGQQSAMPAEPTREVLGAYLGGPKPPAGADAAHPWTFGERVPFALSSAMRDLEMLTGKRRDFIERAPKADSALALVGAGRIGEALLAEVARLRAEGHDVGAVRVVAWRPFPAARLVKALSRAVSMTVLEGPAAAVGPNGPLAMHLKAAFADALTWAPDYPGIGAIPRVVSGFVTSQRDIGPRDTDAMVRNMMRDELGKRSFVLGDNSEGLG